MFEIRQHVRIKKSVPRINLSAYGLPSYFGPGDVCVIEGRRDRDRRYSASKVGRDDIWYFKEEFFEELRVPCMFNKEDRHGV